MNDLQRLIEDFLRHDAGTPFGSVHGWINTAGACTGCNGARRDLGLLVFLHRRRWSASTMRPGDPVRATRRVVRRWPAEATAHLRVGRAARRGHAGIA